MLGDANAEWLNSIYVVTALDLLLYIAALSIASRGAGGASGGNRLDDDVAESAAGGAGR